MIIKSTFSIVKKYIYGQWTVFGLNLPAATDSPRLAFMYVGRFLVFIATNLEVITRAIPMQIRARIPDAPIKRMMAKLDW